MTGILTQLALPKCETISAVDLDELETTVRARLQRPLPGAAAQWRFAPTPALKGWSPDLVPETARRAAALILLYPGADGPSLPLTERRSDLPHHPGQISLPSGAIDPGESAEAAALREAEEEIGIDPARVRVIGPLSSLWVVVSNFVVEPFVAVHDGKPEFRPEPREVETVIEAPVRTILDPAALQWSRQSRLGIVVDYPHFDVGGHLVWGATAMMLGEFAALFDSDHAPPIRPGAGR